MITESPLFLTLLCLYINFLYILHKVARCYLKSFPLFLLLLTYCGKLQAYKSKEGCFWSVGSILLCTWLWRAVPLIPNSFPNTESCYKCWCFWSEGKWEAGRNSDWGMALESHSGNLHVLSYMQSKLLLVCFFHWFWKQIVASLNSTFKKVRS